MQRKWEKRAACSFWTLRLTVPNSPITYNLSNFITGCRSLGDKIIEVLLYLWNKCSLFCFVSHAEISQTTTFHGALLVSLESSRWIGVHYLGLRLFGAIMWKPLIIEPFFRWKLNKIETENCIAIWGPSWCYWKSLGESDLIELISRFSELRCRIYWYFSGFCCWKSNNKLGLSENQLSLLP
jgi:hypothetical protein